MPHEVKVTINTTGSTHSITVVPEELSIPAGDRQPIQWKIQNPAQEGWKFRNKGIDIENPGTEFDHPTVGGNRIFTWSNNHTKPGRYKYWVRVESGGVNVDHDPTILNN